MVPAAANSRSEMESVTVAHRANTFTKYPKLLTDDLLCYRSGSVSGVLVSP